MMSIAEFLAVMHPVSAETAAKVAQVAELTDYPKHSMLVSQGKRCDHIFMIVSGICRGMHDEDGKEDTRWFATTGDVLTSISAWHTGEPAIFSIQAVTDVQCYRVKCADLRRLLAEYRDLQDWVIKVLMDELYVLERRYIIIGTGDAYSRYAALLSARPGDMLNQIPLKYIAQYLKVTQATLSRVRVAYGKT